MPEPRSAGFVARYHTLCPQCGSKIAPGQWAGFVDKRGTLCAACFNRRLAIIHRAKGRKGGALEPFNGE